MGLSLRGRGALQELYFRHLHGLAAKKPGLITFEHRKAMWDNYEQLFDVLNTADAPLNLPPIWLWDMIDEFLYQFQTYRALAGQANQQPDIDFLKANPNAWAPEKVHPHGPPSSAVICERHGCWLAEVAAQHSTVDTHESDGFDVFVQRLSPKTPYIAGTLRTWSLQVGTVRSSNTAVRVCRCKRSSKTSSRSQRSATKWPLTTAPRSLRRAAPSGRPTYAACLVTSPSSASAASTVSWAGMRRRCAACRR